MRLALIFIMLLNMTSASRADDLTDMPEIACAQASTILERQQIGCPDLVPGGAARPNGDTASASGQSEVWRLDTPEH